MSQPAFSALICSLTGNPPTISKSLIFGFAKFRLNISICLSVCSASSFDGSMMRASGALFSRFVAPRLMAEELRGDEMVKFLGASEIPM
jgi:hypothetical protein